MAPDERVGIFTLVRSKRASGAGGDCGFHQAVSQLYPLIDPALCRAALEVATAELRHPAFRRGHEQVGCSRDWQAGATLFSHLRLTQILLELSLKSLMQLINLLMQRQ